MAKLDKNLKTSGMYFNFIFSGNEYEIMKNVIKTFGIPNNSNFRNGFPHQSVSSDIWWYYMVSMSFYWSLCVSQFFDVKRKDFWQMFIHHIAAILLMCFSWVVNVFRIGSLVLVVHDSADIFLEVSPVHFSPFNYFITRWYDFFVSGRQNGEVRRIPEILRCDICHSHRPMDCDQAGDLSVLDNSQVSETFLFLFVNCVHRSRPCNNRRKYLLTAQAYYN